MSASVASCEKDFALNNLRSSSVTAKKPAEITMRAHNITFHYLIENSRKSVNSTSILKTADQKVLKNVSFKNLLSQTAHLPN